MKTMMIAAIAALSLGGVATAYAGEANNEPFPAPNAGSVVIASPVTTPDTGSQAFPAFAGRAGVVVADNQTIQSNASEAEVETANSLPRGFEQGTVEYAQAQSVRHYLEAQVARHGTQLSQR